MAAIIALAGCDASNNYLDPYQKPYVWHPTGAPMANVAAQLADPRDMIMGHGITAADAKQTGTAIDRVWQDRGKPIASSGSGASPGASAGTGGGTGGTN